MKKIIQNFLKNKTFKKTGYCLLLLLPTIAILWFISIDFQHDYDTSYYLKNMQSAKEEGIFFRQDHEGYRSYLFPYFFSLFPVDLGAIFKVGNINFNNYSIISITLLLIVELIVLFKFWGKKLLKIFYIGLFLNPLLLVYIPYPLQESFILLLTLFFLPILIFYGTQKKLWHYSFFLGLFLGLLYMTRSSLVLLVIPGLISLFFLFKNAPLLKKIKLTTVFIVSFILFIIPQCLFSYKFYNTLDPYPVKDFLEKQLIWGESYLKYTTNLAAKQGPALPYWNPLNCKSTSGNLREDRVLICKMEYAKKDNKINSNNIFKILAHSFNALNYDSLTPYIVKKKPVLFYFPQILSMLVVFLGLYCTIRKWVMGPFLPHDIFLDGILLATLAVTALIAVETRFGMLATLILSLRTIEFLLAKDIQKTEAISIAFGSFCFLLSSSILSIYVLSYSGLLSS